MTDDTVAYMGWGISAQEQIDGFRREVRELKAENALLWEQGALLFDKTLELGTENDRLRTQLADVTESMGRVEERCAKLRELAGELWTYAEQELLCDENCPYGDTCDWMEPAVVCVFRRRMRELGVEVDA